LQEILRSRRRQTVRRQRWIYIRLPRRHLIQEYIRHLIHHRRLSRIQQ
jgi:hypothetical protein